MTEQGEVSQARPRSGRYFDQIGMFFRIAISQKVPLAIDAYPIAVNPAATEFLINAMACSGAD